MEVYFKLSFWDASTPDSIRNFIISIAVSWSLIVVAEKIRFYWKVSTSDRTSLSSIGWVYLSWLSRTISPDLTISMKIWQMFGGITAPE